MAAAVRPWWVPLLAVGSFSLGGVQALSGGVLLLAALAGPEAIRGPFALYGAVWFLPGLLLCVSGLGVLLGRTWGRWLSLGTVAASILGLALVAVERRSIPPAMADLGQWVMDHPDIPKWEKDLVHSAHRRWGGPGAEGGDPFENLRNPSLADSLGWGYAIGCCALPVLPWCLVLVVALAPPWGKRVVRDGA